MTILKRIPKELAKEVKDQADRQSVLEERKVSDVELIEKYIKQGLKKDKKKRYIKKEK